MLVRKNDGGRTDKGLMWDPAESQKGSFAKGAITDPQLGLQPFKGSFAAGIQKDDGCNSAGDMSVPPPRGSFSHMADTHAHHEDGQLGKDEPHPGEGAGAGSGAGVHTGNDQAAGVGAPEYQHFAQPFGNIDHKNPQELRHYHYEGRLGDVHRQVKDHGFQTYLAGGRNGKPDLANKNYNTKHLMIYDPEAGTGGDFGDAGYTHAWRAQHELAHALTYPEVNKLYGEGRRIGKLGTHRTLNEARRAVHWEWLAGHRQRELAAQLGIHVNDADFAREMNTIMHDAAHRAVTGKFTEPGAEGFQPHQHLVPLETALGLVNEHGRRLGLQDPHSTIKKSEKVVNDDKEASARDLFNEHDALKHGQRCFGCGKIGPKGQKWCDGCKPRGVAGGGEATPPKTGEIVKKGEVLPFKPSGTPAVDQGQAASVSRLPTTNTIGSCDTCGTLGHLTHTLATNTNHKVCTTCANHPKSTGMTVPNTKSEPRDVQVVLNKAEPQSTSTVAPTELHPMADGKAQKYFSPEQARLLLAKALHARIDAYSQTLDTLQKRETLAKAEKEHCEHCGHSLPERQTYPKAHSEPQRFCSERCRTAADKPVKKALSGGMGAGASPSTASGPQALGKVAPPGREEQVRALKPKVGTASAFKIAWASYNHGKEAKKNMTGGSENVSSGTPGLMMAEAGMSKQMPAMGAGAGAGHGGAMGPGMSSPSSGVLAPMAQNEPQPNNLREKQSVPVKTSDPRSNSFVTSGNNFKAELDASLRTPGRTNTLKPKDPLGGALPGDKVPPEVSHGDASGNIHPAPLEPGGMAPSNKVPDPKGPPSKDVRKGDVPEAKPPSGNPTAAGAKPPQSKPSGGGIKTPKMPTLGALKSALEKTAFGKAGEEFTLKEPVAKADVGSLKAGAVQGAHAAAPAGPAAKPVMPTPAEHQVRNATFQAHAAPGKFPPAGGGTGAAPAPAAVAKPAAPATAPKPAAPVGGIKAPSSGSLPVSSASAFGAKPKPIGAGSALQHLPKLKLALNRGAGAQQQLQRSEKAKK
jgi:hypothetical protein